MFLLKMLLGLKAVPFSITFFPLFRRKWLTSRTVDFFTAYRSHFSFIQKGEYEYYNFDWYLFTFLGLW